MTAAIAPALAVAAGSTEDLPCDPWPGPAPADPQAPRIQVKQIGGVKTFVLLPTGYAKESQSYPVVYLVQGGVSNVNCFLLATDLIEFTASQPLSAQAIVVMPDGGPGPYWKDWRSGAYHDETLFLTKILPFIDREYRTRTSGRQRAIGGLSAGALGALNLAGRNPDRFAAVGAFSGIVYLDENDPGIGGLPGGIAPSLVSLYEGRSADPSAVFGNPVTDAVHWHNANPGDLAPNYRGMSVRFFTGNGTPCDAEDVADSADFAPWILEAETLRLAEKFASALVRERVPHRYDKYGCGIHTYRYFERDIHQWWETIFRAFGTLRPRTFDYRNADPAFRVWGWGFRADPRRAPEFLEVRNASRRGVTLSGSGTQFVHTRRYFRPLQRVRIVGARDRVLMKRAGPKGRIRFRVDLGPPHEHQQYTPEARAAGQDEPGYFKMRKVRFRPLRR